MRYMLSLAILLSVVKISYAQTDKKREDLLKPIILNACNCVDSVETFNRTKDSVIIALNKCIDKQTIAYQSASQLYELTKKAKSKDQIFDIIVVTDKKSETYKKYYNELENNLMENCISLKNKISSHDLLEENSWSSNPKAVELYENGVDEFKKANYKKAISYFQDALKIDPKFVFALDNLGYSYRNINDYDKALEAYKASLEINPNGKMPLQNIAVVYQYKKEYEKAITAFKRLTEIDSKNPESYYGIAIIYGIELKDYQNSLNYMCKAYKLYIEQKSPYRADAEKFLGRLYNEFKTSNKLDDFKRTLNENGINLN